MNVGDKVRVTAPFSESFPGMYEIIDVVDDGNGNLAYFIGDFGAFDAIYLEKA